jgi:hypothetical protein
MFVGAFVCASLVAGCDGTARPAKQPVSPAGSQSSSGLRPERLRAALVDRVGKADYERARKSSVVVGEPLAWGRYGSLDHAMTTSIPITPPVCGQAWRLIGPAKDPAAPAAAISLRQSSTRSGGELLVATSPGNVAAELGHRVPASCHRIGYAGATAVMTDVAVPWPAGQARGVLVRLNEQPESHLAFTDCTVFFATGHGRLLGVVSFTSSDNAEACRMAVSLAHAADRKAQTLI